MSYIVKNCPCYTLKGGYYDCWANPDTWCENITDCVIKQMIETCTNIINTTFSNECFELAKEIINLFDIEEINK